MRRIVAIVMGCAMLVTGAHAAEKVEYADIGMNTALANQGATVRLAYADLAIASENAIDTMKLVFFKDTGNKQLFAHWVPGDPRNDIGLGSPDVPYITDLVDGEANDGMGGYIDATSTTAVIDFGMSEWDGIDCATLPIFNLGAYDTDFGFVQNFFGFGGLPFFLPFITHGGWLPGDFFDALRDGGADSILGVTFTLVWIDENGEPTDIDQNGKADVAVREIYMNNNFAWEVGNDQGRGVFDIAAVMIHEQGHALSQAHFGEISLNRNGRVIISPAAGDNVMLAAIGSNSAYDGFHGTDEGGHCSIWGTWPIR